MRIALDTNSLYVTRAGTSRYVRGLVRGLKELGDPDLQLLELAWAVENFDYRQPHRTLKTLYRELVWSKRNAPIAMRRFQADLLHRCTPSLPIARPKRIPEVVTVCDLAILRHPERYRRWQRFSEPPRLQRLQNAGQIICISQFTADEVMQLLGIPASRLQVVYLGSDFDPRAALIVESRPDFEIPERFFLFVGSLEPGKNLALLKETYLLAETKKIVLPPLLIIGARWAGVGGEGKPPGGWRFLGHQSDEVLAWLYSRALALLFPSKYEGFGFPVLEAMSRGCPVVCSRVASLPEVGGEAVWYAEMKATSYLEAITALDRDDELRSELIEKGIVQSQKFSWRRCAEETVSVYKKVLSA